MATKSAILSLEKLNQLIGMGLIDEEMLEGYDRAFFESNTENGGTMINISDGVEGVIEAIPADRCVISKQAVSQLMALGLIKQDKIENKEITINVFESKFENQGALVNFSKAVANPLEALLAEEKPAEVDGDNELDLGAPF